MKKNIYKNILIILPFLLISCKNKKNDPYDNVPYVKEKNVIITNIKMEKHIIDGSTTSLLGKWSCFNDKLMWGDYFYGSFYIYNTDYKFEKKVLSKGNGPNEIPCKKWFNYSINEDKIFI